MDKKYGSAVLFACLTLYLAAAWVGIRWLIGLGFYANDTGIGTTDFFMTFFIITAGGVAIILAINAIFDKTIL